MAINTSKVVVGGIMATLVQLVVGFVVFQLMLGARFAAEMDAAMPGSTAKMQANVALSLVGPIVSGFLLAWLYAAMRPRFGAGMKTAVLAAIPVWAAEATVYLNDVSIGMMSWSTYCIATAVALVMCIASAAVAGVLYKEVGAPGA